MDQTEKDTKYEIAQYLDNAVLILLGILLLAFPLVFTTLTTDAFILPKQMLLAGVVLLTLILWGAKMVNEGEVKIRRTPFDIPVLLFGGVILFSALFSVNRADSLPATIPAILSLFLFFIITNTVKTRNALLFLLSTFIAGAALSGVLTVLSFFKIYLFPFQAVQFQTFTPLGSLLDQALYIGFTVPVAAAIASPIFKGLSGKKSQEAKEALNERTVGFSLASGILLVSLGVVVYELFVLQQPVILPYETGFQTAFAAISQDTGRVVQGFFLGSGYGTFMTDFTRFKPPTFNLNETLWSLTFFRSSSFFLEILATTGILGVLSFLFLINRIIKEKSFFVPILLVILASFLLPFSYVIITSMFILLALFAAIRANENHTKYFDVELYFVALKKGILALSTDEVHHNKSITKLMPAMFLGLFLLITALLGYYSTLFAISDITFQESLIAASQNNGKKTYELQNQAIQTFPYRDAYYRIFSQTNLALANSLALVQPQNGQLPQDTQQNILTLIQQSINAGRAATTLAPYNVLNWQNLASIYRSLIGFGQNADAFAEATSRQAIALDPNNPQAYINLGGIYYQLGLWDEAQRQFQIATGLKPDLANAFYNLGHALESKGDQTSTKQALAQYQRVRALVANNPANVKKIEEEITALEAKIGSEGSSPSATVAASGSQQPPLAISSPSAQLPPKTPPISIAPPPNTTPPAGTPTPWQKRPQQVSPTL